MARPGAVAHYHPMAVGERPCCCDLREQAMLQWRACWQGGECDVAQHVTKRTQSGGETVQLMTEVNSYYSMWVIGATHDCWNRIETTK